MKQALRAAAWLTIAAAAVTLVHCAGGGAAGSSCTGSCQDATTRLEIADIQRVIAQAVNEAQGQGTAVTIAVVDRSGNVLAVYRMNGARALVTISSGRGVTGGLENLAVPGELAAVAKAITGAYLSSEGNAFSTRTASQIVQEHFDPGENGTPGGPLFGVQFSQLPCSDLANRFSAGTGAGPHRSPLGLSADPGGFPLYRNGVLIGGVGVAADDTYGLDPDINDRDHNLYELIAWAGTYGYSAPADRRADH
ncbi:MAG: GlcG/HbpS family heme-binding protein, partial [Stenotrophobium sp.]